MNEQIHTLHYEIDGQWSVRDMAQFLAHTRDLYNLAIVLRVVSEDSQDMERFWMEIMHFSSFRRAWKRRMIHPSMMPFLVPGAPTIPNDPEMLSQLASFLYPQEELQMRRIEYGSPGFSDLTGLGDAIGHVKDFVLKLLEYYLSRRKRNLEDEERELRNHKLRIENAREFVRLARECGYTEAETRKLVSWVDEKQETFIDLIENGKLRKVLVVEEHDNKEE